jgi:hypothetical protein
MIKPLIPVVNNVKFYADATSTQQAVKTSSGGLSGALIVSSEHKEGNHHSFYTLLHTHHNITLYEGVSVGHGCDADNT